MNLDSANSPIDILQSVWGYDAFRPLQEQAIQCILRGQDSLTVLPTGGGKSICFQLPALCVDGLAVVVSPLISLMQDQVNALQSLGIEAAFLNSTQTSAEQSKVVADINNKKIKLLFVAPERLVAQRTIDLLRSAGVSFFAIDEAHCISNWGHDFRPEYRELRKLRQRFPEATVHGFTATASEKVRKDIADQLALRDPDIQVGSFDRPNLTYRVHRAQQKDRQILDVIDRFNNESGIVYCISRKEVDRIADLLLQRGYSVLPYHAGLDDRQRKTNQDSFIKDQTQIIVATVAFGMGIDKPNVRYVVHSGMPKSVEHYQQESGRAGRDGLPSECVLIYSGADLMLWKRMIQQEGGPAMDTALESLNGIGRFCNGVACRHKTLVEYFGQSFESSNCGACDVCLGELKAIDGANVIAQKILSCVVRTGQKFGGGHVAKVLIGSRDKRVVSFGHDQLTTYGLLSGHSQATIGMWIDQLVDQRFLKRQGEYQVITLTESSGGVLKGTTNVCLTQPSARSFNSPKRASDDSWEGVDRGLFERLRSFRRESAEQQGIPAYIVFGDSTLRDLARIRPTTNENFLSVKGIGEKKAAEYGSDVCDLIEAYCEEHGLPPNVSVGDTEFNNTEFKTRADAQVPSSLEVAFDLFEQGMTIEGVAERMKRATSTTQEYFVKYITSRGITDPTAWITAEQFEKIVNQIKKSEDGRLRPIREALGEEFSYEAIRIAKACYENSLAQ